MAKTKKKNDSYARSTSGWNQISPDTPINAATISQMKMRPGFSNIGVYTGPESKLDLPKGLSPNKRDEYGTED